MGAAGTVRHLPVGSKSRRERGERKRSYLLCRWPGDTGSEGWLMCRSRTTVYVMSTPTLTRGAGGWTRK